MGELFSADPSGSKLPALEKDILAAYDLRVNCYVTKPVDMGQFIGAVRSIEQFWLSVVKLPAA